MEKQWNELKEKIKYTKNDFETERAEREACSHVLYLMKELEKKPIEAPCAVKCKDNETKKEAPKWTD